MAKKLLFQPVGYTQDYEKNTIAIRVTREAKAIVDNIVSQTGLSTREVASAMILHAVKSTDVITLLEKSSTHIKYEVCEVEE